MLAKSDTLTSKVLFSAIIATASWLEAQPFTAPAPPETPPLSPKPHSQVVGYEVPMAQFSQVDPGKDCPALEAAREAALAALEELVRAGVITRYEEEWPGFDQEDEEGEGDALYFAAYAPSRDLIEERMAELSLRLTKQYDVPVLFVSLKDARA
jgi:hypothetical protein